MFAQQTLIKGAAKHSGRNDGALYSVKKLLVKKAYLKLGEHDMVNFVSNLCENQHTVIMVC